jgi:ribonuclease BN (tRNA processing enzyme)
MDLLLKYRGVFMKFNFYGTSHGLCDAHRACSCTLLTVGENTYVFDAGTDLMAAVNKNDIPLDTIKAVFVTHPHTDHTAGLPSFCDQITWYEPFHICNPAFYFPHKVISVAIDCWRQMFHFDAIAARPSLNYNLYSDGFVYDDGVIKVSALRTDHIKQSFAFLIEAEGKTILYSGDMSYNFTELPRLLGDRAYDLVVCEAAHHARGAVNELLSTINTKNLVINHVEPVRAEALMALEGNVPFNFNIADDGFIKEI